MWGPYSGSAVSRKSEIAMLNHEAEALKEDLDAIQARIKDLEREPESDKKALPQPENLFAIGLTATRSRNLKMHQVYRKR
jgi:predicted  nucleic acid-binding Zn-ribbon protein